MIPEIMQDALLQAMTRFDQELRATPAWEGWEHDSRHRFAIAYQGHRYPVKQIISLATGAPTSSFSGGAEANTYVKRLGFEVVALRPERQPRVWWVNQGDSFPVERRHGFLWAPRLDQRGAALSHWETLSEVEEDDLIIHYREGSVRAISRALSKAYASDHPFPSSDASLINRAGRRIDVEYVDLTPAIARQQFGERLRDLHIPQGPLDRTGNIKQGYLWRFTAEGLNVLREVSSAAWPAWVHVLTQESKDAASVLETIAPLSPNQAEIPQPAVSLSLVQTSNTNALEPAQTPSRAKSARTQAFISYSHQDARYLAELQAHLATHARNGELVVWDDTKISPGSQWREEIGKALESAKVAVLLVSVDFLASEFIAEQELPTLLAAAKGDGARILPVILRPCAFLDTKLAQFQAVNNPDEPVSGMPKVKREEFWVKVARLDRDALKA